MLIPNHPYFIVRIDKAAQTEKRTNLKMPVRATLGIWSSTKNGPVVIESLQPEGAASKAGFNIGDTLTHLDGVALDGFNHLAALLDKAKPEAPADFRYISKFMLDPYTPHYSNKWVNLGSFQLELKTNTTEMDNNLQYGEIVAIGKEAAEILPKAKLGNVLLFHHSVEYKPRETGDTMYNDKSLVATLKDGDELRIVDARFQTFGVFSLDDTNHAVGRKGVIYPHPEYIFCHYQFKKASFQMVNGMYMPDAWEKSIEELALKLEDLKTQYETLAEATVMKQRTTEKNYRAKEQIMKLIDEVNKERYEISKNMNKPKLVEATVLFVNEETCTYLGKKFTSGSTLLADYRMLYPLQFAGSNHLLARRDYVLALLK